MAALVTAAVDVHVPRACTRDMQRHGDAGLAWDTPSPPPREQCLFRPRSHPRSPCGRASRELAGSLGLLMDGKPKVPRWVFLYLRITIAKTVPHAAGVSARLAMQSPTLVLPPPKGPLFSLPPPFPPFLPFVPSNPPGQICGRLMRCDAGPPGLWASFACHLSFPSMLGGRQDAVDAAASSLLRPCRKCNSFRKTPLARGRCPGSSDLKWCS